MKKIITKYTLHFIYLWFKIETHSGIPVKQNPHISLKYVVLYNYQVQETGNYSF